MGRRADGGDGGDAWQASLLANHADASGLVGGGFVEEVGERLGAEKATVHRPWKVARTGG